jgi:epoxyqueuosine reductase
VQPTEEQDFIPRNGLDAPELIKLFAWSEEKFLQRMQGSSIRRLGYECWMRNIAVALGNAESSEQIINALKNKLACGSELVREHVSWALGRHTTN